MTITSQKKKFTIQDEDMRDSEADLGSSESDLELSDQDTKTGNEGWADSIAKILKSNKPKGKKTLVLSRAKKLNEVRSTKVKPVGFEVATEDGHVEKPVVEETKREETEDEPARRKKRELPNLRVKPSISERNRERTLSKIATKGVVQLFNAVRSQQKTIDIKLKDAGNLDAKRDKVLQNIDKTAFLNVLMGAKSIEPASVKIDKNQPTWSVLREDFMMGARMKDWDKKEEEEEEESERVVEIE